MAEQEQSKRTQISIHVDEALRERLELAARHAVRSLSGEITFRLLRSLESDYRQIDGEAA